MKKILSVLICIFLILSCVGVVQAREESEKKTYIVILDTPSVYSPDRVTFYGADDSGYREVLLQLQAEVRAQINGGVSAFSLRNAEKSYTYTDVLNGFTVNVDAQTAEQIKKIDGVKAVYEDKIIEGAKPAEAGEGETVVTSETSGENVQVSQANSGNMINTQAAYNKGYCGQGRAIAIIDSAIVPEHIYYALSDESTAKYTKTDIGNIIANNTMNVSATADDAYRNAKIPFAYNYASNSDIVAASNLHGAHVAGIAAGNTVTVSDGVISGVAPEAQILFFGVFGSDGAALTDIIAAIEDAVKFDVDTMNLSLGSDNASEYEGIGVYNDAVMAARNSGITVVYAGGNSDRLSYSAAFSDYGTSDNRNYLYSSKVGSIQSEYAYMTYLEDENGNKYPCVTKGSASALSALQIADCGSGTAAEIAAANVSGKIAVITMPEPLVASGIPTYGTRAMNAGAAAVVVAYNSNDLPDGSLGYAYSLYLVSKDSGEDILENSSTLKYTGEKAVLQRISAPQENAFSSYGYSDTLDIAIDFSAPGGNIYSSYGGTTKFANLSGTSMAAPQVTGATTLMYQYVEGAFATYTGVSKVMLVKNLLASTAETIYDANGALSSPRKVGAGLVQLDKAMETKVILKGKDSDETKITLGADLAKKFDVTFTAYNLGSSDVTFSNVAVELSTDDYKDYSGAGYGFSGIRALPATVSGASSVTVPASGSCDVTVTVTLSDSDIEYLSTAMTNGFFIDGKVTLSGSENNCSVGIPFTGFYGNWASMPIMTENRFLNYFSVSGISGDGFAPPAMITKADSQLVMPISDNPDASVADIPVAVFANPLRNAFMSVKCDDTVVIEDAFINKLYDFGYYMGEVLIKDLSAVSTITVDLRLPYESEPSQTYTIHLAQDNDAPVISDIYVQTEGGTDYAYLMVSDNCGVGVITKTATASDGEIAIDDAYIQKSSATAAFDITDMDDICYFVYDCAFNMTALTPDISIDVANNTATYTNNTHKDLTGECMIAVYEGGKMVDFKKLSESAVTVDAYGTTTFDVSAYSDKNYKLFFWKDTTNTFEPLCDEYATN